MRKVTITILLAFVLLASSSYGTVGQIWNMNADYSDVLNPNGPWSFHAGYGAGHTWPYPGVLLKLHGEMLPCGDIHTWQREKEGNDDCMVTNFNCMKGQFPEPNAPDGNDILTRNPNVFKFQVPESGTFKITGRLWQIEDDNKQLAYTIAKVGEVLDTGSVPFSGGVTLLGPANAADFNDGNGLVVEAEIGDYISLTIDGFGEDIGIGGGGPYGYSSFIIEQLSETVPYQPGSVHHAS